MYHALRQLTLCLLLAMPVLCISAPSHADIDKSEAASRAQAQYGGKVLSVKKVGSSNGQSHYQVKLLLDDGRVKTVTISG